MRPVEDVMGFYSTFVSAGSDYARHGSRVVRIGITIEPSGTKLVSASGALARRIGIVIEPSG